MPACALCPKQAAEQVWPIKHDRKSRETAKLRRVAPSHASYVSEQTIPKWLCHVRMSCRWLALASSKQAKVVKQPSHLSHLSRRKITSAWCGGHSYTHHLLVRPEGVTQGHYQASDLSAPSLSARFAICSSRPDEMCFEDESQLGSPWWIKAFLKTFLHRISGLK